MSEETATTTPDTDTPEPLKVLLVDDHPIVLTGLRAELAKYPEQVHVIGQAQNVDEAVVAIKKLHPDVVLLDIHLPGGGGGGGVEVAAATSKLTKHLALSVSDSPEDVVQAIRAGARGYVTKTIRTPELIAAIERVAAGDAAFSPRLAGFVLDAFGTSQVTTDDDELDLLTAREREVMRLIARGYTYKEAASELYISVKTIETHVSAVLRKLQLSNRGELTRWAARRRLV